MSYEGLCLGNMYFLLYRGILLKDLVAIDTQGKDYIDSSQHLNLNKYKLLWTTLSAIRRAQMCMATFSVDADHVRILQVSVSIWNISCDYGDLLLALCTGCFVLCQVAINQSNMNDNALEELSWAREPRQKGGNKESITTTHVDDLPKFSEWAAGRQSSLDIDTLNKHVKQMVGVSP